MKLCLSIIFCKKTYFEDFYVMFVEQYHDMIGVLIYLEQQLNWIFDCVND